MKTLLPHLQSLLQILIPSVVTIVATIIINSRTEKFKSKLDTQSTLFKSELENQKLTFKNELTNQELIFKSELEKSKKISEIYYEERARVLQELYILMINRSNDVISLLTFLGNTSKGAKWPNPKPYYDTYEKFELNELKLIKTLLYATLYLKDDDYQKIKVTYELWNEPVGHIVDLFTLYEKIPEKNSFSFLESSEFTEFAKQVEQRKLRLIFEKYVKASNDFTEIKEIIRNTIASPEIQ